MMAAALEAADRFDLPARPCVVQPLTIGHIHESFIVETDAPTPADCATAGAVQSTGCGRRFLLQRVNQNVFPDPDALLSNMRRVTEHVTAKLRAVGAADAERRVLTLVPTVGGAASYRDSNGAYWRMMRFIEGTTAYAEALSPAHAERAGRAFGEFQRLLADLPPPRLVETIPHFHDTPRRYGALRAAIAADARRRVKESRAEIEFALAREAPAGRLLELHRLGEIPERIVHNDAKISNVLFDARTDEPLCVVDLDTVMPGLALFDFGDMVRSMTCAAPEDERDLSRVSVSIEMFAALARGYLVAAGRMLTSCEREHLVLSGWLISLEQGVRFLTDFLAGDAYYRAERPRQNLDRCRTQFALVRSIERQRGELEGRVAVCESRVTS